MSHEQLLLLLFTLSFICSFIILNPINFALKRNLHKLFLVKIFTILFGPWMDYIKLTKFRIYICYFLLFGKFFKKNERHKTVYSALYWEPFYQYEKIYPQLKNFRVSQESINPEILDDIDLIMVPNKLILSELYNNGFQDIANSYFFNILEILSVILA